MNVTHYRGRPVASVWLALLLIQTALTPVAAWAQTEPDRRWSLVPELGFGATRVNGGWNSAGLEAAVDLEYGGTNWRGNAVASLKGVGVGCSHACFEGGPAVAVGVSRSLGAFWVGGGAGVMRQFGTWRPYPYGRIFIDATPFRLELRAEFPQHTGSGVYIPVLVGMPIPGRASR